MRDPCALLDCTDESADNGLRPGSIIIPSLFNPRFFCSCIVCELLWHLQIFLYTIAADARYSALSTCKSQSGTREREI